MEILNLTQHMATQEQKDAGVIEPEDKKKVQDLLTFNDLPSKEIIENKARMLAGIAISEGVSAVMIGGEPYLMSDLESHLKAYKITPLYAFTKRVVEEVEKDGEVVKTSKFVFEGFVEV